MKEIKFKAWDTLTKSFLHIDEIDEYPNDNVFFNGYIDPSKNGYGLTLESEYVEFLLYTGFKDCNGEEIYEGDILQDEKGNKYIVYWSNDWGAWFVKGINNGQMMILMRLASYCCVIGNEYENPQLLKV
jgi:hypothetical protein